MELHLYPDMVILPDFCIFVYYFAKKMTNKIIKLSENHDLQKNLYYFFKKFLHYSFISYIMNFGSRMDSRVAKGGRL